MKTFALILVLLTIYFSTAFANEVICPPENGRSALMIIDMQPQFYTRDGHDKTRLNKPQNQEKLKRVMATQIEAIKMAKRYQTPIIMIEYDRFGATHETLKKELNGYKNVHYIKKSATGTFQPDNIYRSNTISFLKQLNIGTLVVAGANGDSCVGSTVEDALHGNCNVVAYSNAIIDFNYDDYIHPYSGKYGVIKPKCKNCKLREVSDKSEIERTLSMGNVTSSGSSSGVIR